MPNNYIQKGERLVITADADVASGGLVFVGALACVAQVAIAAGNSGAVSPVGVYDLPKATGVAFDQGDPVYYDSSAGKVTNTTDEGANKRVGLAWEAAATGAVLLNTALNIYPDAVT